MSNIPKITLKESVARMVVLESTAHELAEQPFDLNSYSQIAEILFRKNGLPVVKKSSSGNPVIDDEVLRYLALDYRLPKIILEYRRLSGLTR